MDLSLGCTRLLIDESKRQGLLRNQCAYVLATAFWETAHTMRPVVEAYWLSEAWRKKNLRYYPWHGRGFVQLTWEANYIRAEKETGSPVHQNPQLALDPNVAATIAVTGMREGWFTGRDLDDFIDLQHSDFKGARAIINGRDKDDEIAAIARQYDADLKREGYN
ncbi:carboxypeptidase [Mesorhizobium sp. BR1-1-6]|uniref:carboxypeptidase n=1 Tax=Mesorhizobium sp. BR1-1-6 TaxID=2876648 RepID=UPI001CD0D5B2|nr:carboxypeptidase [Mesorhizobium sp. BR1-1-6]MBZ9894253.1 carboxypeptidase [Mesorhizobium sp. BR1-1-6]